MQNENQMLPRRQFLDMNASELASVDTADWIAVVPLGATEYHGPHLPPETDTLIAEAVAARTAEILSPQIKATFLPAETVGYSPEHLDRPGTKSLDWKVAIENWIGMGLKLSQIGIGKLVFLNAHGGNSAILSIVATELRVRHDMLAVTTGWLRFGIPFEAMDPEDQEFDIHGGLLETSVMLAIAPESVAMDKARDFENRQRSMAHAYKHLRAYGRHAFGWKMSDLNTLGAAGNALEASADTGRLLVDHAAHGLCELLQDVQRHPGFRE